MFPNLLPPHISYTSFFLLFPISPTPHLIVQPKSHHPPPSAFSPPLLQVCRHPFLLYLPIPSIVSGFPNPSPSFLLLHLSIPLLPPFIHFLPSSSPLFHLSHSFAPFLKKFLPFFFPS